LAVLDIELRASTTWVTPPVLFASRWFLNRISRFYQGWPLTKILLPPPPKYLGLQLCTIIASYKLLSCLLTHLLRLPIRLAMQTKARALSVLFDVVCPVDTIPCTADTQ
jgi:hypothetical protein